MIRKHPAGIRCPRCGASARDEYFPFCSDRCRLIDLGRWIDGSYRIPGEASDEGIGPDASGREKTIH
jgi:endogenous inhibitor of DNA gyrase (YacG/DUF329 family)